MNPTRAVEKLSRLSPLGITAPDVLATTLHNWRHVCDHTDPIRDDIKEIVEQIIVSRTQHGLEYAAQRYFESVLLKAIDVYYSELEGIINDHRRHLNIRRDKISLRLGRWYPREILVEISERP